MTGVADAQTTSRNDAERAKRRISEWASDFLQVGKWDIEFGERSMALELTRLMYT